MSIAQPSIDITGLFFVYITKRVKYEYTYGFVYYPLVLLKTVDKRLAN